MKEFVPNTERKVPNEFGMRVYYNRPTKMRDGVTLYGDLYLPEKEGSYPAIVIRYMYDKSDIRKQWYIYDPADFVARGYAVFVQDVRGTGESEGDFFPWVADGKDGYDTVEWVAGQEWCDGNVGMMGLSFFGFSQLVAAVERPPHLRAICPFQTGLTLNINNNVRGFVFSSHIGWILSMALARLKKGWYTEQTAKEYIPVIEEYLKNLKEQFKHLPIRDMPAAQIKGFPAIEEYTTHILENFDNPEYYMREGKLINFEDVQVPVFGLAGWMDTTRNGVVDHYLGFLKHGNDVVKQGQKLVLGPWGHGAVLNPGSSEMDFGYEASGKDIGVQEMMIDFFDRYVKGIRNGWEERPPVKIFVIGKNIWRDEWEFPPKRAEKLEMYLHSEGAANSLDGDGVLNFQPPDDEPCDSYDYDPKNPVPTLPAMTDHRVVQKRGDVLVYTSPPLEKMIEVTGLPKLILHVSSSARDTDFCGKLLDVFPDGRAISIGDGGIRARYRNSWEPEYLSPSEKYEIEIPLEYISYAFLPGHRIRIEVTSSNFPKFDFNHNTGKRPAEDIDLVVANNCVYHEASMQSRLVLPVINDTEQ